MKSSASELGLSLLFILRNIPRTAGPLNHSFLLRHAQVTMEFRHPDGRHVPVVLPRRSLLVMTGESRYLWSHG